MKQIIIIAVVLFLLNQSSIFATQTISATQVAEAGTPAPDSEENDESRTLQNTERETREKLIQVLFMFLVLSVVFETALTPIFNWRVFCARFDGKGVKTPLTVIAAVVVFWK